MDGLSGAASGMAVVSLALQLSISIKQLYDFWDSVKEAPDNIRTITTDLNLLSSVLAEMAFEEQHFGPDLMLTSVLQACCDRVKKLTHITRDMEPGFASRSLRIRRWTAFKAVLKTEKILGFQHVLERLKITLILAQQSYHSRLDRIRYQNQQQNLTAITNYISGLRLEQMSASVTTLSNSWPVFNEHTDALRAESSRICRSIPNPIHRVGFELGSDIAVHDIASSSSKDQSMTPRLLANVGTGHSIHPQPNETLRRSRPQTLTKDTLTMQTSTKQTFFGTITTTTQTCLLRSRIVKDDALDDEEYQYERKSSFRILPAQWLLKLGFNYAYNISTQDSSTQGWQWCIKPINLVPDDAPIFEFCEQGDIEKVRDLFSRKVASVRDIDSGGWTALHCAVKSYNPELCKFLIEAGANKNVRSWSDYSPLQMLDDPEAPRYEAVNAIDTCRIFEDSFDFWDKNGDGWYLLKRLPASHSQNSTSDIEGMLTFLPWFIESSSPDIKANYVTENVKRVVNDADDGLADVVGLLVKMGHPLDDFKHESPLNGPIFPCIRGRKWNLINMLLKLGADPHQVSLDERYSPIPESPLSSAIYSSWAFWAFRKALHGINLDVEDIIREELKEGRPLFDAGWQMETLRTLLEMDVEPDIRSCGDFNGDRSCDGCGEPMYMHVSGWHSDIQVQPYWQGVLKSIRNGTYAQKICSDAEAGHPLNGRLERVNKDSLINATDGSTTSHDLALSADEAVQPDGESFISEDDTSSTVNGKDVVWCVECWHHFKKTGRPHSWFYWRWQPSDSDDSSEDEGSEDDGSADDGPADDGPADDGPADDGSEDDFSPFLFNY